LKKSCFWTIIWNKGCILKILLYWCQDGKDTECFSCISVGQGNYLISFSDSICWPHRRIAGYHSYSISAIAINTQYTRKRPSCKIDHYNCLLKLITLAQNILPHHNCCSWHCFRLTKFINHAPQMRSVPCINQAFCNHHPRELSSCTEVCAKNHCYNRTLGHWLHLVSKSKKPPNFWINFLYRLLGHDWDYQQANQQSWVWIPILLQNVK
jgi:hypothetical protein